MRPSQSALAISVFAISVGAGLAVPALLPSATFAQELAEIEAADAAALVQTRADEARRAQALSDRDTYLQSIAALEASQGIYTTELSEAYIGLANTLLVLEQDAEAADAFGKAFQALRIGYGLADLRQLPVLEQLRTINERRRKWDEVDAATHLMFFVVKNNPEATQEQRMDVLHTLGDWIRRASAEDLVSDFAASVGDLLDLYGNEIGRLEEMEPYPGRGTHLATLYLDLAATELSEAKRKYEMPLTEFQTPGAGEQRTATQQTCFTAVDRSGRTVQACTSPMEVPNVNYYLAPNVQKSTEIRAHLADVENNVIQAYRALQNDPGADAVQVELVEEVHRLTVEYNEFIALNKERPF